MTLSSLSWVIFGKIIGKIEKKAEKRMSLASSVKELMSVKETFFYKRKRFVIIYFSLLILLFSSSLVYALKRALDDPYDAQHALPFIIVLVSVLLVLLFQLRYVKSHEELFGNIFYQTVEDFINRNKSFYLYLRGFDADIPFSSKNSFEEGKFNESFFAEMVDYGTGIPMCALGLSKEVDSPIGAQRIYADNTDWQEKVILLMENAKGIFILVSNRVSCIWEIEQSKSMKEKTVFIVDDSSKYSDVLRRFRDDFKLPEAPCQEQGMFYFVDGGPAISFSNTEDGYLSIVGLSKEIIDKTKYSERKQKYVESNVRYAKWASYVLLFSLVAMIAISLFR